MKKIAVSIMAAILVSLIANPVTSASYNFTPLIYPGAFITGAYGNNDFGQIVGEYIVPGDQYPKGFIYEASHFTPFTIQGAISTTLNGINNAGDLVGAYGGADGKFPFFFSGNEFTHIDIPGSTGGAPEASTNSG